MNMREAMAKIDSLLFETELPKPKQVLNREVKIKSTDSTHYHTTVMLMELHENGTKITTVPWFVFDFDPHPRMAQRFTSCAMVWMSGVSHEEMRAEIDRVIRFGVPSLPVIHERCLRCQAPLPQGLELALCGVCVDCWTKEGRVFKPGVCCQECGRIGAFDEGKLGEYFKCGPCWGDVNRSARRGWTID